jgi:hypothetical protein
MTPDGRLVTGGYYEQPSYQLGEGGPEIYSGLGEAFPLSGYGSQLFVACYSEDGEIDWFVTGQHIRGSALLGLAARANGDILIAYSLRGYNQGYFEYLDASLRPETDSFLHDPYAKNNIDLDEMVGFSIVSANGTVSRPFAIKNLPLSDWTSFNASPDGGFVISSWDYDNKDDTHPKTEGYNLTTKIGPDFRIVWQHKVRYISESCCTFMESACKSAVAPNGDVYVSGNVYKGVRPDGAPDKMAPILDEVSQYNQPYESYIARFSAAGKLQWIKYTGAKTLISDIATDGDQIVLGGKLILVNKILGFKPDTTEGKACFLANLRPDGKLNWLQTFNGQDIEAVSINNEKQIFAAFESVRGRGMEPIKIGTDTIPDSYKAVIVACFDAKGKYLWYKTSRSMLSRPSNANLLNDRCGNLFFTAEMWYVLPANLNIFDAAFVKGRGYGGAPLAAKIRTTIPDEVLALNVANQVVDTVQTIPNQSDEPRNQPIFCASIPYPWILQLFPNPSSGLFSARCTVSYTDSKVRLELHDMKGVFIRELMSARTVEAGTFDHACDISDLPAGNYIVMLRGSGKAAVTQLLVLQSGVLAPKKG